MNNKDTLITGTPTTRPEFSLDKAKFLTTQWPSLYTFFWTDEDDTSNDNCLQRLLIHTLSFLISEILSDDSEHITWG